MKQFFPKIETYVDDQACEQEWQGLQKSVGEYVCHELSAPNVGDLYLPLAYEKSKFLSHSNEGFKLINNICLHRQAPLVEKSGPTKMIRCPLHSWTYDIDGNLHKAAFFDENCIKEKALKSQSLKTWNGLLFLEKSPELSLENLGGKEHYNFENFQFHSAESSEHDFNWKVFLEIYLENYHVFSVHPGLKNYVNPSDLEWVITEDSSLQLVGLGSDLTKSATPIYKDFQQALMDVFKEELPRYGAVWTLVYPNIMLERYPGIIVISTVVPKGARKCINHVEYFYDKDLYSKHPEYFEKHRASYIETAQEDEQACLMLQKGREAQYKIQLDQTGPIHDHLELGLSEFYNWLAKHS